IAILIVSSLDGTSLEDYSMDVATKWKLGTEKNDNGVLILVAVNDRKMRIEVGRGLEGALTDIQTNRIIRNEMAPAFRRGDYDGGIESAVQSVAAAIGGEYNTTDAGTVNEADLDWKTRIFAGLFIFGILGVFTFIALFTRGCAGWGLYVFLIPFYGLFPWIA